MRGYPNQPSLCLQRDGAFPAPLLKEVRRVSPRCASKRIAHRVGTSGYSSTSKTGSRTGSDRRGCCSKSREAGSPRTKGRWARSIVVFVVLLVVGVTALLSMRATVFSDASAAINATGEVVSSSSKGTSISELPKTGGP
jgi:hypothetical protein